MANADLSNATINGANFSGTTLKGFTEAQLKSTKSYQEKNLSSINLGNNDLNGWNFSGQNLTSANFENASLANADLSNATINGANFSGADLRGATFENIVGDPNYKNTIMTDGTIKNFRMMGYKDNLLIRKYENSDGKTISAKISDYHRAASISLGAKLTLENGAAFEITSGAVLDVGLLGMIQIDTDLSGSTKFTVGKYSSLYFSDGATLTVNIVEEILSSDVYDVAVISFADSSRISGLGDFVKSKTLFLTVNGKKFSGAWDYALKSDGLYISLNIPEPATYAVVFGLLAMGVAVRRNLKRR